MILVENSSFAPTPDSCDYSNVLSVSHPLTPFTPFDNSSSPSASSAITAADDAYDLDLDEIDQLLFSDQEDQNSNSAISSSSSSIHGGSQHSVHSAQSAHSDQLIVGSDLLYGSYLAEEEEDDSSFLELDLSDASSEEQDDDLSSLTPSVQRLFCSTSMSNYSTLSSSSVLSSTLLEQHQQHQQQLQNQQPQHHQLQEAAAVAQQHQLVALGGSARLSGVIESVDTTGRLLGKNAFASSLVNNSQQHRNSSSALFNSKVSPYVFSCGISSHAITSTTHQFDNISASGSSSSSTPSTPGAYHPQPSSSSSSASSTTSTLPSFSEIYSPRGLKANNFDCTGDFFKFEDAFSEGDNSCISAEADESCAAAAALQLAIEQFPTEQLLTNGAAVTTSAAVASGQFDLLHPQIILKEEPMDSFVSTSANISANVNNNQTLCNFVQQQQQQPKQEITQQSNEQQIKNDNTMIFRADSPKPMRYHLHNLSMSVMQQQQQQQQQPSVCDQAVPFDSDPFESDDTSMDRLADFEAQLIQQVAPMPLLMSTQGMQSLLTSNTSAATSHSVASTVGDNSSNPLAIGSVACGGPTGSPSSHAALFSRGSSIGSGAGGGKMRTTGANRPHKAAMQICAVCGDVAACQHYGVLTCEGCKGFFKRTVQKNSKYTCLGNKDCTVDKRRRNRCQSCRFAKCLAVGMVKEVVRTDNLKGRRGRLPSKPKNPSEAGPVFPMTTISALVKAHVDTSNDKQNLDFSQYTDNVNLADEEARTHIDSQLLTMLNRSLNNLYAFMEKIPGFNEFNDHDKKVLFQNSCLELFALRMAYRIKPGSLYFILSNNVVMHRNQFAASFGEWLPLIEQLSNQLNTMELDISSFACLSALTVITGRCGVQDLGKVDELETKIINALKDHTMYHCDAHKKPNYFSRILSKLSELRTIGELGHRVVTQRLGAFTLATANADIRDLTKKLSTGSGSVAPFNFASTTTTTATTSSSSSTSSNSSSSHTTLRNLNVRMETSEGVNISSNFNPNQMATAAAASTLPDLSCLDLPSISSFFKWQNMK